MTPPITIDVSLPGEPPRRSFALTMPEVVNTTTPPPRPRASRASRQSRTVKNSQGDTVPAVEDADGPPASAEAENAPDPGVLCTRSLREVIESRIPDEMAATEKQTVTTRVVRFMEAAAGDEPRQTPKCQIAEAPPDRELRQILLFDERESRS
jgi:hypothetical protein